ncbi:MAG: glycoside hydrolase family 5 protein [Pseudomonadota bacterium]|nr:glycoside hydrolase family 5 protein [Pseudomonadota bacterium]
MARPGFTAAIAAIGAVALGLLSACASTSAPPVAAPDALAEYPPLASGPSPGASPAARRFALGLGRGVNFGNMLDAPTEGAWRLRAEDRYIALVGKDGGLGIQSVRLPVRWSNHASADARATIDPVFMSRVESVVQGLLRRGVPVVLDMHHYRQFDGDALDAGESAVPDAVVDARFLALWKQVAERFRGYPETLAFELYNEPHGRLETRWNDLLARGVRLVRQSNPARILVVGPTQWNSARALATFVMPADPDLILTIHHYDPFAFSHQGAPWAKPPLPTGVGCCDARQLAAIRSPLDAAERWAGRNGYPVFLGEFGAYETAEPGARSRYTRLMRTEAEIRGMPWTYWELAGGFGFIDPATGGVRRNEVLEALFGP